jgi:predicted nucleic acid-binding Zn ribbon protein
MRICQTCYTAEKRARDARNPALGLDGGTRCAKCAKTTPGSASDYWYRSQRAEIRGERICKACHGHERRERMNEDPNVSCVRCERTELTAGGWRKNKNGGYWCEKCYKASRLDVMNNDPSVRCGTCGSQTSGPPEWRKAPDGSWLCRVCLAASRLMQKKSKLASLL